MCVTQRDGTPLQLRTVHIFYDMPYDLAVSRRNSRLEDATLKREDPRPDDGHGVLEKRIEEYRNLTVPMLKVLRKESNLIEIDASKTIEEIREETLGVLHQEVGFLTPEGMRRKSLGELL